MFFFFFFLRRVRSALQYQNVFCSGLRCSEEPEAFLPVLLGGGRGSHHLGGVLLVGCGGLGSGGLWHALGRVAHLPCAYHLAFLQTEVMLYTTKGKTEIDNAGKGQWFEFKPVKNWFGLWDSINKHNTDMLYLLTPCWCCSGYIKITAAIVEPSFHPTNHAVVKS